MKQRKLLALLVVIVLIAAATVLLQSDTFKRRYFKPKPSSLQPGITENKSGKSVEVVAQNLTVPWEIAFLPDGDLLVTERTGKLKRIGKNNLTHTIEGVQHTGEGGLLGLTLHPEYQKNKYIYIYLTSRKAGGLTNRVERYRYDADKLSERTTIIDNIPGASYHDGGRIAFGPDNQLYITTGDAGNESLAQDKASLAGKILRIKDDGSIPSDNPFGSAVYSYGHRNPQGLAWDDKGQLWSTEHGRSGAGSGFDELNIITKGSNYGWPAIEGDEAADGMVKPAAHSGANETWAPASLAYHNGSLYFGGLRGEALYQAVIENGSTVKLTIHYKGEFGRIRAASTGPDKNLYISSSNTDGRGDQKPNDDKILKINL